MTRMRKGQTYSMFAEWMDRILPERSVLGHAWEKVGEDRWHACDWSMSFQAGGLVKVSVSFGKSLWLSVWTAREGKDGLEFDYYPRSLRLHWLRTARETAHHVCAVIGLVADAIEHRSNGYSREEETE